MANMVPYVKFIRGTTLSFSKLAYKDKDTLYFIYDNKTAPSGLLYLGDKLISGGGGSNVTSLGDLSDVLLNEGKVNNSLLTYDASSQKWVDKPLEEIFEIIVSVFKGATDTEAGTSGLVPAPAITDKEKFLKGDGTWATIEVPDISDLEEKIYTLIGDDTNKSVRTIAVEEIAKIVAGAPEDLDTLKEIAEWIKQHPQDVAELNAKVNDLQERMEAVEGDIVSIEANVTALGSRVTILESTTQELDERLRWWDLDIEE